MRSQLAPLIGLCLLGSGCMGTSPSLGHDPERGLASVLVGVRFFLPSGQTRSGEAWINLEGEGDHGNGETYRIPLDPGLPMLYQIEPDLYRLAPTRSIFGTPQPTLKVRLEGRTYRAPFPREVTRKAAVAIKSRKIVSLGILEFRLSSALPGRHPSLKVRLDDSASARSSLVQEALRSTLEPTAPNWYRNNAVTWSRALEETLVGISAEPEAAPLYKRAGP